MNRKPRHQNLVPLLTKRDVAQRLGLTLRTTERWIANGIIPSPDVGVKTTLRWKPETLNQRFGEVF